MPAVTAIGVEKLACCQPAVDSLVKCHLAEQGAGGVPETADMGPGVGRSLVEPDAGDPAVLARGLNFTPRLTELVSLADGLPTAVWRPAQIEQGH